MSKVTVVGAGFVGATAAQYIADKDLADVVLIDIIEGIPQGKALDLLQAGPINGRSRNIVGTNAYADTKNSDVIVITAGIARKPGMSRDDLLKTNAAIVKQVATETLKHSPDAIYIVVTNPLDVMTFLTWETTKLPHQRVIGMAGVLDSARFQTFISMELNVAVEDIRTMVLGGHGDLMVPIPRFSTVNGIPITELLPAHKIEALCKRTCDGGAEIVSLLKSGSAYYAPAASVTQMVEAVLKDKNRLLPCAVFADGHYGIKDIYVGLPAIIGRKGVQQIVDIKLDSNESAALKKSADSIKQHVETMKQLLVTV